MPGCRRSVRGHPGRRPALRHPAPARSRGVPRRGRSAEPGPMDSGGSGACGPPIAAEPSCSQASVGRCRCARCGCLRPVSRWAIGSPTSPTRCSHAGEGSSSSRRTLRRWTGSWPRWSPAGSRPCGSSRSPARRRRYRAFLGSCVRGVPGRRRDAGGGVRPGGRPRGDHRLGRRRRVPGRAAGARVARPGGRRPAQRRDRRVAGDRRSDGDPRGGRMAASGWLAPIELPRPVLRTRMPRVAGRRRPRRRPGPVARRGSRRWPSRCCATRCPAVPCWSASRVPGTCRCWPASPAASRSACPQCARPMQAQGPDRRPSCRTHGAVTDWRCPVCGGQVVRAVVVGVRRTAEEFGRALPGVQVVTSSGQEHVRIADPCRCHGRGHARRRARSRPGRVQRAGDPRCGSGPVPARPARRRGGARGAGSLLPPWSAPRATVDGSSSSATPTCGRSRR